MRIVYNNRSGCFTICTTKNKPSKKDTMLGTESPLLGDAETQPSDCSQCYEQDMKTNGCIFNTACYQSGTWDKTVCDRVNGKLCPSIATDNLPLNINYEINYEIHNIVLSYNIDSPEYPYDKTKNIFTGSSSSVSNHVRSISLQNPVASAHCCSKNPRAIGSSMFSISSMKLSSIFLAT